MKYGGCVEMMFTMLYHLDADICLRKDFFLNPIENSLYQDVPEVYLNLELHGIIKKSNYIQRREGAGFDRK